MAFLSKSLNETKRNYEIYDKKMLVVIRGLENWRLSQIRYSLVIILELNSVLGVQYKDMMIDR